jgi:hypothetical protein
MSDSTLGDLIHSLSVLTVEKKHIEVDLQLIESKITKVESEIMNLMDAGGIEESASAVGKVTVKTSTYPQIEKDGWLLLEPFILESGSLALLQQRIAVMEYRGMLALRRAVPGVVPFHKRKLTYRPLNNDD